MVQLVVYNQSNGDSSYLDLGDVSIKADYSSIEIQDISKRKSESTQAFTLPFTDTNNSFFSHFYNVNASGDFDSNSKVKASILVDSIEVLDGYLQLLKVDANTEKYDVVVMGEVANIVKELGSSLLNELDLSEYNHVWSKANILASWNEAITYTNSTTGNEILYPIVDYGYNITEGALSGDGSMSNRLSFDRLKPSIKVKALFYKILGNLGYTINSTFLNDAFFTKQYMTLANETQQLNSTANDYFKAEIATGTNTITIGNVEGQLAFPEISTNLYSNFSGGSWSPTHSGAIYSPPIDGRYKFRFSLFIKPINATGCEAYYTIRAKRVFSGGQTQTVGSKTVRIDNCNGEWATFTTKAVLIYNFDNIIFTIDEVYDFVNSEIRGSIELIEAPSMALGSTIDLSAGNNILPKEKQSDFISSILSRYNLVVVRNKDNPKELNIEPAYDYFIGGTSKDWTDKLDESKNIEVKPTSEYQYKELYFSDLESDDKQNLEHQQQLGAPYNSYQASFNNDFAKDGQLKVKSIFSSYTNDYFDVISGTMLIGQQYAYDGESPVFVESKPKLFVYSGKKNVKYRAKDAHGDSTDYELSEYPFCSTYYMQGDAIGGNDDFDIRFDSIAKFGETVLLDEQVLDDTFELCWRAYLNGIYGKDARILIANFNLNSVDIANFNYNDRIFVKDAYYRINKIKGYSMGNTISTKVELLKVNIDDKSTSFFGCNYQAERNPTYKGFLSFKDSDGNFLPTASPDYPICCEANGGKIIDFSGTKACIKAVGKSLKSVTHTTTTTEDGGTTIGRSGSRVSIEGTIAQLGESASDGQILSWSSAVDSTRWITFPDQIPLNDGQILIGDSSNAASKSTLQGDANISVTKDDAGGTTTIGLDSVPAAGTNGQIQVNDNGDLGTGTGLSYVGTTLITPNITATADVDVTGDVTADNFIGDGSQLTNIPTNSSSGNAGVVQQSDGSGGFIADSSFIFTGGNTLNVPNIDSSGDISANTFTGNGSGLTNLTPGGSAGYVQFNQNGALGGYSTFTFNQYSGKLKAPTYLGENISGSVYQDSFGYSAMYLTPDDFRSTSSSTYNGFISNNGGRMGWGSTSNSHFATFQVPKGYKVTSIDFKGSANYSFYIYSSSWSSANATYITYGTINTLKSLLASQQLVGNSGDYFTIKFTPSSYGNYVYGCKLLLYPT